MSARRSGRSKAPVRYTSDSDGGSDFGDKKSNKKAAPKKRTKTEPDTPKKRTKKDPQVLAAEHKEKAAAHESKASKAAHKQAWDTWVDAHSANDALLDDEPGKDVSITQTDAGKKYGLKKEDMVVLKHFEKRHPVHNNTMKLYLENEVKELGFRKLGVLEGENGAGDKAIEVGEGIWMEQYVSHDVFFPSCSWTVSSNGRVDTKTTKKKKMAKNQTQKPPRRNGPHTSNTQVFQSAKTTSPMNPRRQSTRPTARRNTSYRLKTWRR